jgi:excisionase family DNA binding protein
MAKLTKTVDEAAIELGVHHLTLRKAIARGEVRAVRIGRRILIPVSELERLLEGRELPAAAP